MRIVNLEMGDSVGHETDEIRKSLSRRRHNWSVIETERLHVKTRLINGPAGVVALLDTTTVLAMNATIEVAKKPSLLGRASLPCASDCHKVKKAIDIDQRSEIIWRVEGSAIDDHTGDEEQ
jgi:hypothetical protein